MLSPTSNGGSDEYALVSADWEALALLFLLVT
jgi:hypothetical protein